VESGESPVESREKDGKGTVLIESSKRTDVRDLHDFTREVGVSSK
jgi:hypothetical protein